ncbi:hypothetical protein KKB55_04325 [Myxococcota bacterium]|nr:hypothetical protein [Myxococcota bacterium]
MIQIKRASVEECLTKALPILIAGYEKRGQRRSEEERSQRNKVKLERDDEHNNPPQLCSI